MLGREGSRGARGRGRSLPEPGCRESSRSPLHPQAAGAWGGEGPAPGHRECGVKAARPALKGQENPGQLQGAKALGGLGEEENAAGGERPG